MSEATSTVLRRLAGEPGEARHYASTLLEGLSPEDRRGLGAWMDLRVGTSIRTLVQDGWSPNELADLLAMEEGAGTLPLLHHLLDRYTLDLPAASDPPWRADLDSLPPAVPVAVDDVRGMASYLAIGAALVRFWPFDPSHD